MNILNEAFGWIIRMCAKLVDLMGIEHGYALTILLFSIVCQLILFPFAIKQQKNSQKQARLRPKENVIRRRYNGRTDRASQMKMNEELQKLYQEEHFSPFSGCLPLLIQLPIIFALFYVIRDPLTYIVNMESADLTAIYNKLASLDVKTAVIGTAKNMNEIGILNCLKNNTADIVNQLPEIVSKYDIPSFMFWKIDLSLTPDAFLKDGSATWHILLIPIATFLSAFFGQKLTRKFTYQAPSAESASSMKLMNVMMPLLSAYFAYTWAAAMGLYWTYRSVLSLLQQIIVSKMYPIHNFTEEELKAEEKSYMAKLKGKGAHKASAPIDIPGRKSLIFDDDDEDIAMPEVKHSIVEDDAETPPQKGSGLIDKAPLKDDEK